MPTPGPSFLDAAERRFGRFAIPGLIRLFAILQALSYVLNLWEPEYIRLLVFDRASILQGEVWRLVTYVFLPPGDLIPAFGAANFLFILLIVMFLFMISDGLEQAWGVFRVNFYVFVTMLLLTISGFVFNGSGIQSFILFSSLLFAFAANFPDQPILFMLILPMKIKYVAWITAILLGFTALSAAMALSFTALSDITLGLTPFFVSFLPGFFQRRQLEAQSSRRRQKFEAASRDLDEAFHTCARCGKTERDDPQAEFRVAEDGEEYCDEHLPDNKSS